MRIVGCPFPARLLVIQKVFKMSDINDCYYRIMGDVVVHSCRCSRNGSSLVQVLLEPCEDLANFVGPTAEVSYGIRD